MPRMIFIASVLDRRIQIVQRMIDIASVLDHMILIMQRMIDTASVLDHMVSIMQRMIDTAFVLDRRILRMRRTKTRMSGRMKMMKMRAMVITAGTEGLLGKGLLQKGAWYIGVLN